MFLVLEQLGEPIPSLMSKESVAREMEEVQTMIAEYSDSELLELPKMTDERKLVR